MERLRFKNLVSAKENLYGPVVRAEFSPVGDKVNSVQYRDVSRFLEEDSEKYWKDWVGNFHYGADINRGIQNDDLGDQLYAAFLSRVTVAKSFTLTNGQVQHKLEMEIGYNFENRFIGTGITNGYFHLQAVPNLSVGTIVQPGQRVAKLGNSGASSAHLHHQFTIPSYRRNGAGVITLPYINQYKANMLFNQPLGQAMAWTRQKANASPTVYLDTRPYWARYIK